MSAVTCSAAAANCAGVASSPSSALGIAAFGHAARRGLARFALRARPAEVYLREAWLAGTARGLERVDHVGVGRHPDQAVGLLARELRGALPARGDDDRRRRIGAREELRLFDGEVLAASRDGLTRPQVTDHADRFAQHRPALRPRRPPLTHHVLVQPLAGAEPEEEATRHHHLDGRSCVRDGERVQAVNGRGHPGADAQRRRRARDPAEHRPHERAVALLRNPGRDVVRDHRGAETRLFRADRVVDQRVRRVFLTREPVAELEAIG